MKKLFALLFVPLAIFSQTLNTTIYETNGGNKEFYFSGTALDSGVHYSSYFELGEYDGVSFTTYPLHYVYEADSVASDTAGTDPIFKIEIEEGWANNDPAVVDTITALDTALTSTHTPAYGTIDLNNNKAPKYRIKTTVSSYLGKKMNLKLSIYAYKRD